LSGLPDWREAPGGSFIVVAAQEGLAEDT